LVCFAAAVAEPIQHLPVDQGNYQSGAWFLGFPGSAFIVSRPFRLAEILRSDAARPKDWTHGLL
jgi:hypothetical protein